MKVTQPSTRPSKPVAARAFSSNCTSLHQEAMIHVSNVQLIDPDTKKPARAGYRREDDKKIRISRSSGKDI